MRATGLATALLVAAATGCTGGGTGQGPPPPAGVGTPRGPPQAQLVDAATGGEVTATDAAGTASVTLSIPPGALAASTEIVITEIGNTAPGGVGSAWRIGPDGLSLATPATLTFRPGVAVDGLVVSTQAAGFYWIRRRDVTRDLSGGALSVSTNHLSDWAVTTGTSERDLQGVVTLTGSVEDLPATVTGSLTLDYVGDYGDTSYYVLAGTLHAPAQVVNGALTCTPTAQDFPVRTNIAELRASPARFRWGTSGVWPVDCGTSSSALLIVFDNMGLAYRSCTRTDLVPPVVTLSRVEGQYLIDCGAQGQVTASWSFVSCAAGAACTPSTPCRTGEISCATPLPSCVETGVLPDGSGCGTQPADACVAGACEICSPTATCTPTDPCRTGTVSCDTSPSSCVPTGDMPDGTHCGTQAADQCLGGACSVCVEGAPCGSPSSCQTAATDCSTFPSACTVQDLPDGTSCGPQPADVCLGGACSVCVEGAPCGSPGECQSSATDCSTFPASCTILNLPDGTSCSVGTCTGGVCG
jgi:hypothetical protein